jgi:hypothetical protein
MFGESEWLQATSDNRLARVRTSRDCLERYDILIRELAKGVDERDLASVIEVLRKFVPDYNPSEELLSLRENPAAKI